MSKRHWFLLLSLGVGLVILGSFFIASPGYMDADYYLAVGRSLANGDGFQDSFIWNYLADPESITHPSNQYWMPFTSIISAASIVVFGDSFRAGQLPFLVLASLLPILTAAFAYWIHRDTFLAVLSGFLALFPGFYAPYFLTTDHFIVYAFIGTGVIWGSSLAAEKNKPWYWTFVGVLIGIGYLTRTDGLLLLLPAGAAILLSGKRRGICFLALGLGVGVITIPWFVRNVVELDVLTSPGASRSLWLTTYNELFAYPTKFLTPSYWVSSGLDNILKDRVAATLTNIKRLTAENGLVFLWPLIILGAYRYRKSVFVRISTLYLVSIFVVMSFVFPYAGPFGGLFHASSALMPVLWALAPVGLRVAVQWGREKRGWESNKAEYVFGIAMIVLAAGISGGAFFTRVIGADPMNPSWENASLAYQRVSNLMKDFAIPSDTVAVNNPPGFHLASGREAVVIPYGDEETLKQVVERYRIDWVVLDSNRPPQLANLYDDPNSLDWLDLVADDVDLKGNPVWILRVETESMND